MGTEQQKERVRTCFLDAAKRLVLAEGPGAVTVRRVAEIAGFSYATIYGYFADRDTFLWHVLEEFIGDVVASLSPLLEVSPFSVDSAKAIYHAYASYFIEHPAVFELLFFHRMGPPPQSMRDMSTEPLLALTILEKLDEGKADRAASRSERSVAARIMTSSIHGVLMMHLSGKRETPAEAVLADIDAMIDFILGRRDRA